MESLANSQVPGNSPSAHYFLNLTTNASTVQSTITAATTNCTIVAGIVNKTTVASATTIEAFTASRDLNLGMPFRFLTAEELPNAVTLLRI